MTFDNQLITYRVAFDTKQNLFMAYDAKNSEKFAFGITIEQAVKELHKSI